MLLVSPYPLRVDRSQYNNDIAVIDFEHLHLQSGAHSQLALSYCNWFSNPCWNILLVSCKLQRPIRSMQGPTDPNLPTLISVLKAKPGVHSHSCTIFQPAKMLAEHAGGGHPAVRFKKGVTV